MAASKAGTSKQRGRKRFKHAKAPHGRAKRDATRKAAQKGATTMR